MAAAKRSIKVNLTLKMKTARALTRMAELMKKRDALYRAIAEADDLVAGLRNDLAKNTDELVRVAKAAGIDPPWTHRKRSRGV